MSESFPLASPLMSRRSLLNFLAGAVVASTASSVLYPVAKFFVAPKEAGEDGSILAKDINGNFIPASQILAEPPGTRALVAGLAAEPTYLTVIVGVNLEGEYIRVSPWKEIDPRTGEQPW